MRVTTATTASITAARTTATWGRIGFTYVDRIGLFWRVPTRENIC
jgi:hypothetical protein